MIKRAWVKWAAVAVLVLCAGAGLAACGGGGSTNQIAEAETHGEEKKEEEQKETRLEEEIQELKKEREAEKKRRQRALRRKRRNHANPAPTPTEPSQAPAEPSPAPTRESCGGTLTKGATTSCPFAEETRREYEIEIGSGEGTIYPYSAANNEVYEMTCTPSPHECFGAINAEVFFP